MKIDEHHRSSTGTTPLQVVQDLEATTLAIASGHLASGKDEIAEAQQLVLGGGSSRTQSGTQICEQLIDNHFRGVYELLYMSHMSLQNRLSLKASFKRKRN